VVPRLFLERERGDHVQRGTTWRAGEGGDLAAVGARERELRRHIGEFFDRARRGGNAALLEDLLVVAQARGRVTEP
jgi:hypothetical protein